MMTLPEIFERPSQPYIYVKFAVRMDEMGKPANEGFPQVFAHVEKHGLTPVGPAFYNYRRINMSETLDVEAGVAVSEPAPEGGNVKAGTLPGGRFVRTVWHGHPDALEGITGKLIDWVAQAGEEFDMEKRGVDDFFACRLELYESDPEEVPNMDDWVTVLEFKLRARGQNISSRAQ